MVKWMAANDRRDLNVQGRCDRPFRMKDNKVAQLNKKEMVCGKGLIVILLFLNKQVQYADDALHIAFITELL